LFVVAVTTVLLLSIQSIAASPPPVQVETTTNISEPMPGEQFTINAEITNIDDNNDRNVEIIYVVLREGNGLDAYRQSEDVSVIAPGSSVTIPFSMKFDTTGKKQLDLGVTVSAYNSDSHATYEKPIYIDVTNSDLRGDVRLTSSSATKGSTAMIEGNAANIGGTDVESVLLSIPNTESVSPTPPNGEYYVGGIETSEFGTFELTAEIANDTDSVPVDITYITTGEDREDERVTKTQQIPVEEQPSTVSRTRQAQASTAGVSSPGGGLPITIIGGVAVLVVFSAIGLVLWRKQ
jgi:hypothetical protein